MKLDDVKQIYDALAKRYDFWTDIVFARLLGTDKLREHTVDLLGDIQGLTVLDIGCGTGRNFPYLVPRVGPRGKIVGVDYSEGMLEQARGRARKHDADNIQLIQGDAATLDGVPEPVDAVISIWCLGIVHDLDSALHRAIDVLRPGGRLAIMDFGQARPDSGPLRWLYPIYSRILERTGIDSPEDLDDEKLRMKWKQGRAILHGRLDNVREESYFSGGGFILSGVRSDH